MAIKEGQDYRRRLIEPKLGRLISEVPAVMLRGPRAVGKTTTAARFVASVVSLETPGQAALFRADPDAALRSYEEPILLDEWQEVPEVLGAVRRAVDQDFSPSRFVITGSADIDAGIRQWPGTGRILDMSLLPMTVRESVGNVSIDASEEAISFFDLPPRLDRLQVSEFDVVDYLRMALDGGFPAPLFRLQGQTRRDWLEGYVDRLVTRDASQLRSDHKQRDSERIRRYFNATALNSAGIPDHSTIYRAAGISKETAVAYEQLLRDLYILDLVPAWESNRLKQLIRSPKRYLIDAALIAATEGFGLHDAIRDADLAGRVLETFVVAQLRSEAACSVRGARLHHLRTEKGRQEIDLVVQFEGGSVIACEIKATASPSAKRDAKHLAWLRDRIGDRFEAGYLFHTGPGPIELEDRITALPISALFA